MRRRSLLIAGLLCPLPWQAVQAEMPAGLKRRGQGTFRRFGFLVYEATLWAGDDPLAPPLALRLDYKRTISGRDIAEASVREMRPLVDDPQRLPAWGQRMIEIFPDVAPGDHILGVWTAQGASFYQGERLLGQVSDPAFARAFFAIWLDPRTSAPALRSALLNPPGG